jgi:hypothetical protein
VIAHPVVNLLEDQRPELLVVTLSALGEYLVHETGREELVGRDTLAHDERLIGFAQTQALNEGARGATLGDQAQRREGRHQESGGYGVDEVSEGDQGGAEPNDRAVQPDNEDLGVLIEGARDVEVVGDEGAQPIQVRASLDVGGGGFADGDVGAAARENEKTASKSPGRRAW